jgi:hypothetical protein
VTGTLATLLALNRIVFGTGFLVNPESAGKSWIGPRRARRLEAKLLARTVGARDMALGVGALAALRGGVGSPRAWMLGHLMPTEPTWRRRSPSANLSDASSSGSRSAWPALRPRSPHGRPRRSAAATKPGRGL